MAFCRGVLRKFEHDVSLSAPSSKQNKYTHTKSKDYKRRPEDKIWLQPKNQLQRKRLRNQQRRKLHQLRRLLQRPLLNRLLRRPPLNQQQRKPHQLRKLLQRLLLNRLLRKPPQSQQQRKPHRLRKLWQRPLLNRLLRKPRLSQQQRSQPPKSRLLRNLPLRRNSLSFLQTTISGPASARPDILLCVLRDQTRPSSIEQTMPE